MELLFVEQPVFLNDFIIYITNNTTYKQILRLSIANKIFYEIFKSNHKFENYYFTPKDRLELIEAINEWCINKEEVTIKYKHINTWNTSYIYNFNILFQDKRNFNDNISDWNTSNVKYMQCMFNGAENFNINISKWNVSQVIDMKGMFWRALNFNQNLNNWNIFNVRLYENIFKLCNISSDNIKKMVNML